MGKVYRQARSRRGAFTACLAACLALGAGGCVRDSYAGISLKPGEAPGDLQWLAERAMTGDKMAQLELGERYEKGRGVIADRGRARHLYGLAATTTGGTIYVYVPPTQKGQRGTVMPVDTGPVDPGLPAAKARLKALRSAAPVQEAASDPAPRGAAPPSPRYR